MDFWKKWKKPWTKQQCRQVYIETDKSLRQLSELSGRAYPTISRWGNEEDPNWTTLKSQYQAQRTQAVEVGITAPSQGTAPVSPGLGSFEQMLDRHATAANISLTAATTYFRVLNMEMARLQKGTKGDEFLEQALKLLKNNSLPSQRWAEVMARSIEIQRQASCVEVWQDLNTAIKVIQDMGGEITLPEDVTRLLKSSND